MKPLPPFLQAALLGSTLSLLASCGADHADAPPLAGSPVAPEQKGWIENTTDSAWNAVASPINGLVPKPKAQPARPELIPMDPPETVILTRHEWGLTIESPATQPNAPATAP